MRKHTIKYLLVMSLLPLLAVAKPDFGDAPPAPGGMLPNHEPSADDKLPPFLSDLNLTEAQTSEIKKTLLASKTSVHDNVVKAMEIRADLHRLGFSSEYTEDGAKALITEAVDIEKQALLGKTRLDNAIFQLLTPEQQQKLKERLAHFEPFFNRK